MKGSTSRFRGEMTTPGDTYRNLPPTPQVAAVRDRHLDFYRSFARRADDARFSRERDLWAELLDAELDNVRAALSWSLETARGDAAQDLAASCLRQWERGRYTEGRIWLGRSLASDTGPTAERVRALLAACDLARPAAAGEFLDEAVHLAEQLGDAVLRANALRKAAWHHHHENRLAEAAAAFEQAAELGRGIPAAAAFVADALRGLAWVRAGKRAPLQEVSDLLARSREVLGEPGFEGAACVHLGLHARLLTDLGDHRSAEELYTRKLAIESDPGLAVSKPDTLLNLGDVKLALGRREEARRLWAEILDSPTVEKDNIVRAELRLAGLDLAEANLESAELRVDRALAIARAMADPVDMLPNNFPLALWLKSHLLEHAGDPVEAERLLEERRATCSDDALSLLPIARHAARCGDRARARRILRAALEQLDPEGNEPATQNRSVSIRVLLAEFEGDLDKAWELAIESRGEAAFAVDSAINASLLGRLAVRRRDTAKARELAEAALPAARSHSTGESQLLHCLADAALIDGDAEAAVSALRELLPRWPEVGGATAWVDLLETVARTAVTTRRTERGAELLGLADAERERIVYPRPGKAQADLEAAEAVARAAVDELFEQAKARGRRMDLRTEMWAEARQANEERDSD